MFRTKNVYILCKIFFQKINLFIKISNNSFEPEFISKIKDDIDIIFEILNFMIVTY